MHEIIVSFNFARGPFRTLRPASGDLLEDSDEPFAGGETFAFLVDFLIVDCKAVFEAQVGFSIFPHVDGQIVSGLVGISDEDGLAVRRISTEELRPNSVTFVCSLKSSSMVG